MPGALISCETSARVTCYATGDRRACLGLWDYCGACCWARQAAAAANHRHTFCMCALGARACPSCSSNVNAALRRAQRHTGAMLQLCLTRPPPREGGAADGGAGHTAAITAGELDRLGLLLRGPAEAAAAGATSDLDGSPMDVSPTPFQGAPAVNLYSGAAARRGLLRRGGARAQRCCRERGSRRPAWRRPSASPVGCPCPRHGQQGRACEQAHAGQRPAAGPRCLPPAVAVRAELGFLDARYRKGVWEGVARAEL